MPNQFINLNAVSSLFFQAHKNEHLYFSDVSSFGMFFIVFFCISDPHRHMQRPAQNQHSFYGVCPCQLCGADRSKRTEHSLPS